MRSPAEVKPDGTATIGSRTCTDPRNRASIGATQPVLHGMPYDLRLMFMPRDYAVAAGRRLGLVTRRRCARKQVPSCGYIRRARG